MNTRIKQNRVIIRQFMKNHFRVVHLSTSHTGGAGIAARRLNKNLLRLGVNSHFISIKRKNFVLVDGERAIERSMVLKIFSFVNSKFNDALNARTFFSLTSISVFTKIKLNRIGSPSDTIIHIHNWFNFLSPQDLRLMLKLGYRLVFTLHDMRLLTGGCHYSLDCSKYLTGCTNCPKILSVLKNVPSKNHDQLKTIFRMYKDQIYLIAPSMWMKQEALRSSLCKEMNVEFIANYHGDLEDEGFEINEVKENGSSSEIILGVASMDKNSYLKGHEILTEIEKLVTAKSINIKIVYISDFLKVKNGLKIFWNSIDYLIVPSVQDNSPNVIYEAKSLGIPVIATRIGGISEIIDLKYDYIVDLNADTAVNMLDVIEKLPKVVSHETRNLIIRNYQSYASESIRKLLQVYNSLID